MRNVNYQAVLTCEINLLSGILTASMAPQELCESLLEKVMLMPSKFFTVQSHQIVFDICKKLHQDGGWIDISFVSRQVEMYRSGNDQNLYHRLKKSFFELITPSGEHTISPEKQVARALTSFGFLKEEFARRSIAETKGDNVEELLDDVRSKVTTIADLFKPTNDNTKHTRIRLEVQRLLDEDDIIKKLEIKRKIKKEYDFKDYEIDEICKSLYADQHREGAKVYLKGLDFLDDTSIQSVGWIYPGIFPSIGVSIISGDPGVGKSLLCYDAATGFSRNEDFLNEKPLSAGHVLIVASDELPVFAKDKIINRGLDNFSIITGWDVSNWKLLESTIEDTMPKLVLIDSFRAIHADPNFDENKATAALTIMKLEALCNKYSFACLLIHHNNKNSENKGVSKMAGSAAIAGSASTVWTLEGTKDSRVRQFSSPKIRGGAEPQTLMIVLEPETGRWNVISGGADASQKSCCEALHAWFVQLPNEATKVTIEELCQSFPNYSRHNIYKSLTRLQQQGILSKTHDPSDRKRRLFYLVPIEVAQNPVIKLQEF